MKFSLGNKVITKKGETGTIIGFGESVGWLRVKLNDRTEEFMGKDLFDHDKLRGFAPALLEALKSVHQLSLRIKWTDDEKKAWLSAEELIKKVTELGG